MRDGRVELKGLALTLFLVVIIHRHLMEGYMVLLLLKIIMEDIPKKIIKKRKVVILILMKMIKIKKIKMIIKKYKAKRVIKMKKNLLKMKMKKKRKKKKKQNQLKR